MWKVSYRTTVRHVSHCERPSFAMGRIRRRGQKVVRRMQLAEYKRVAQMRWESRICDRAHSRGKKVCRLIYRLLAIFSIPANAPHGLFPGHKDKNHQSADYKRGNKGYVFTIPHTVIVPIYAFNGRSSKDIHKQAEYMGIINILIQFSKIRWGYTCDFFEEFIEVGRVFKA